VYITSVIDADTFSVTVWQEISQIADTGRWSLYSVSTRQLTQASSIALILENGMKQWWEQWLKKFWAWWDRRSKWRWS